MKLKTRFLIWGIVVLAAAISGRLVIRLLLNAFAGGTLFGGNFL